MKTFIPRAYFQTPTENEKQERESHNLEITIDHEAAIYHQQKTSAGPQ
jgi:hypothetical protein